MPVPYNKAGRQELETLTYLLKIRDSRNEWDAADSLETQVGGRQLHQINPR